MRSGASGGSADASDSPVRWAKGPSAAPDRREDRLGPAEYGFAPTLAWQGEEPFVAKNHRNRKNGAATLASRSDAAGREASGPGVFPMGGEDADPLLSDFGDFFVGSASSMPNRRRLRPGRIAAHGALRHLGKPPPVGAEPSAAPGQRGPARGPQSMGTRRPWFDREERGPWREMTENRVRTRRPRPVGEGSEC